MIGFPRSVSKPCGGATQTFCSDGRFPGYGLAEPVPVPTEPESAIDDSSSAL